MNDIRKNRIQAALRLLELIDNMNRGIEISKEMESPLMVRQYSHLKKEYAEQFQELLLDFKLFFELKDAA